MYSGCISMQIIAKKVYLYGTGYWWYMSKLWHGIQFETNDILRYSLMVPAVMQLYSLEKCCILHMHVNYM